MPRSERNVPCSMCALRMWHAVPARAPEQHAHPLVSPTMDAAGSAAALPGAVVVAVDIATCRQVAAGRFLGVDTAGRSRAVTRQRRALKARLLGPRSATALSVSTGATSCSELSGVRTSVDIQ
eukprot:364922-Chlamydomonas_euryale.AAC.9